MTKHRLYVCPRCSERTLAFVDVPRAEWLRHKYHEQAEYRKHRLQAKRNAARGLAARRGDQRPPST